MTKRALRVYKIVAAAQQTRRKEDDFIKEFGNENIVVLGRYDKQIEVLEKFLGQKA